MAEFAFGVEHRSGRHSSVRSVAIIGGGISGLTVAQELMEYGKGKFEITVYERQPHCGGRSVSVWDPATNTILDHSIKNYSGYYDTLFETMKRIPFRGGSVFDNVLPYEGLELRRADHGTRLFLNGKATINVGHRLRETREFLQWLRGQGVGNRTGLIFLYRHARLLWMSNARRKKELGGITYREYISKGLDKKGAETLTNVLEVTAAVNVDGPASIAAAHALKIFGRFHIPHKELKYISNILSGPQDTHFINPWVRYLKSLGVKFRTSAYIDGLDYDGTRVRAVVNSDGQRVRHDAFVIAIPYNGLKQLLGFSPALAKRFPNLNCNSDNHEKWAHSVYFTLSRMPANHGRPGKVVAMVDSPYSIIFTYYTPEVWRDEYVRDYFERVGEADRVHLWVTFSNGVRPGILYHKPYPNCTKAELGEELLAQLGFPHNELDLVEHMTPGIGLEYLKESRVLEPCERAVPNADGFTVADSLLFAPDLGPDPEMSQKTVVPNLFLAGEYTKCVQEVATMEKACESGKRCSAAMLKCYGVSGYPKRKYQYEPYPCSCCRAVDNVCFSVGCSVM